MSLTWKAATLPRNFAISTVGVAPARTIQPMSASKMTPGCADEMVDRPRAVGERLVLEIVIVPGELQAGLGERGGVAVRRAPSAFQPATSAGRCSAAM